MRIFAAVDWQMLHTRADNETWYGDILSTMRDMVDEQLAYSIDVPKQAGGWIHRYVSPENWLPLNYDRQSPHTHRSPLGDSYSGDDYDGAWRVWRHRELSNLARDAALLYHVTNETRYLDASSTLLRQYADRYLHFAGDWDADKWMLKGRAMNQALTESLWAYPLVLAYDLVADLMPDAESVRQNLLVPIAETLSSAHDILIQRGDMNHNYTAWLLATLGCVGYTLDDSELIERVITGEGGFQAHLSAAILADNIEREATPYYHNFVTLAYSILALAAQANGDNLTGMIGSDGQSLSGMFHAFSQLALPDGTIIEANDGSYWQNSIYDVEICEVYEIAYAQTAEPKYAWLLNSAYQRRDVPRHGWTALLFATSDLSEVAQSPGSQFLKDSGFALLHNENWSVAIPFGKYAGEHSHLDRMSLNVFPFSLDAGTPLYGIEARKTWYKQTLAHNTLVVDGCSQNKGSATCTDYANNQIKLVSTFLYDTVTLERAIQLGESIGDVFRAISPDEHRYDWVFHSDCAWQVCDAVPQPCAMAYAEDGAGQYVNIVAELACDSQVFVETQFDNQTYVLKLSVDRPFQLFLATCPGRSQTPNLHRHLIIARVQATSVSYKAEIIVKE